MCSVSALVLTYNRKNLLADCLDAIDRQTRRVDRIIVIDNASSDGTAEWLAETWDDRVETYRLPQNAGSAGGFSMSMRIGYERGDDLIWLMDDDVIPAADALEHLLDAMRVLDAREMEAPFVISTAWTPEGLLTNVPPPDRRLNEISYPQWPILLGEAMVPVRCATFVSILLKREVLRRHGLPIAGFFMWGEDTEFTKRITREGPGYYVGRSHVVHVRSVPGALNIRTELNVTRMRNHYYLRRNNMFIARQDSRRLALRALREDTKSALQLLLGGEGRKAWIVFSGVCAGLFFRPLLEEVFSPCDLDSLRVTGRA